MAVRAATATTIGVYTRAKRVMKRSIFGLLAAAFSTDCKIRETIDSESGLSTRILITPEIFRQPEVTALFGAIFTGTGSPVTGEVSRRLSPSMTVPSTGILSPARTRIISPVLAFSAGIISTVSPFTRFTVSGRRSTASIIWLRLFSVARSSKYSPIR